MAGRRAAGPAMLRPNTKHRCWMTTHGHASWSFLLVTRHFGAIDLHNTAYVSGLRKKEAGDKRRPYQSSRCCSRRKYRVRPFTAEECRAEDNGAEEAQVQEQPGGQYCSSRSAYLSAPIMPETYKDRMRNNARYRAKGPGNKGAFESGMQVLMIP